MVSVVTRVQPLGDRRFFTWMSIAMAAAAFAGFARTYYLGFSAPWQAFERTLMG